MTEQTQYTVVRADAPFELRDYPAHIVAETVVAGSLEGAGNRAFDRLFRYIAGHNRSRSRVAMTAPVAQREAGERIAMTAPVSQHEVAGEPQVAADACVIARAPDEGAPDRWAVSFAMPAGYTMETLPVPTDPEVALRTVPARRVAAVRYAGMWNEKGYERHLEELYAWIERQDLACAGAPEWARYDPPFKPWFMRRNEVLLPVE